MNVDELIFLKSNLVKEIDLRRHFNFSFTEFKLPDEVLATMFLQSFHAILPSSSVE